MDGAVCGWSNLLPCIGRPPLTIHCVRRWRSALPDAVWPRQLTVSEKKSEYDSLGLSETMKGKAECFLPEVLVMVTRSPFHQTLLAALEIFVRQRLGSNVTAATAAIAALEVRHSCHRCHRCPRVVAMPDGFTGMMLRSLLLWRGYCFKIINCGPPCCRGCRGCCCCCYVCDGVLAT